MANWSNPTLTSLYTDFLSELKARDEDLALQFDGVTVSNLATGTIRWNSTANRWQKWTGSAWGELTTTYALTGLSTTGNASIGGTLTVTGATQLATATATTPATGDNSTAIATTAYVRAQNYAPLASPSLTGTPTAPTAALGTNTTQLATTAFVNSEIANDAPTKTGGGASGTWGISISGNAATATTLQTARTINGVSFDGSANINVVSLRASNGTTALDTIGVTSAVNYITAENAPTLNTPILSAAGSDTNVNLTVRSKGTGTLSIVTSGGNIALRPSAGSILFYDSANTYYTNLDNGSLTANRTLTMPNGNVTLVAGTMVPTTGTGATGTWGISITGSAASATSATTATRWATARTFTFTGDVTGSNTAVDGSANESFALTIAAGVVTSTELATGAVTAGKLSGSQSGSAPLYGVRAWALINMVGTMSIRGSGNLTSVTDGGTGAILVNIATNMASVNYSAIATPCVTDGDSNTQAMTNTTLNTGVSAPSVGAYRIRVVNRNNGDLVDVAYLSTLAIQ